VKFAFIDAKRTEFPITVLCRALRVSRAGYYASVGRPASAHAATDRRLAVLVREAHERSRRTYGSPRVHAELAATHGVFVSRKRVIRIMQQEGLKARPRKRFRCTTMSEHDQPVAPNLLDASSRRTGRTSGGWATRRNSSPATAGCSWP
jgi:putative transposase